MKALAARALPRVVADQIRPHLAGTLETTRRGGLLWLAVLATAALDAATTTVGLAVGLSEGNPVVATALDAVGVPGLVAVQIWFVAAVTGLVLLAGQHRVLLPGVAAVLRRLPVVTNLVAIVAVAGMPAGSALAAGLLAGTAVVVSVLVGYHWLCSSLPAMGRLVFARA